MYDVCATSEEGTNVFEWKAAAAAAIKAEILFESLFEILSCQMWSNWMDSLWICVLQLICISIAIKHLKSTVDSCGTCFCRILMSAACQLLLLWFCLSCFVLLRSCILFSPTENGTSQYHCSWSSCFVLLRSWCTVFSPTKNGISQYQVTLHSFVTVLLT